MPKYMVEITETLMRTVVVEADKPSLAEAAVDSLYYDEDIVLDAEDLWDHNISVDPESVEEATPDYIAKEDEDGFFSVESV